MRTRGYTRRGRGRDSGRGFNRGGRTFNDSRVEVNPFAVPSVASDVPLIAGNAPSVAGDAPSVVGDAPSVVGADPLVDGDDPLMPDLAQDIPPVIDDDPPFVWDVPTVPAVHLVPAVASSAPFVFDTFVPDAALSVPLVPDTVPSVLHAPLSAIGGVLSVADVDLTRLPIILVLNHDEIYHFEVRQFSSNITIRLNIAPLIAGRLTALRPGWDAGIVHQLLPELRESLLSHDRWNTTAGRLILFDFIAAYRGHLSQTQSRIFKYSQYASPTIRHGLDWLVAYVRMYYQDSPLVDPPILNLHLVGQAWNFLGAFLSSDDNPPPSPVSMAYPSPRSTNLDAMIQYFSRPAGPLSPVHGSNASASQYSGPVPDNVSVTTMFPRPVSPSVLGHPTPIPDIHSGVPPVPGPLVRTRRPWCPSLGSYPPNGWCYPCPGQ
jgi:hypothetical protein